METIQNILIDSVSGGFWRFCGYFLIISTVVSGLVALATVVLGHFGIRKRG